MKPVVYWITLSLAANVLLAGWWLRGRVAPPKTQSTTVASAPAAVRVAPDPSEPAEPRVAVASSPAAVASAVGTSWKDFQTDDLKEFIRRLRAGGCPEETVQDIILAEVNRRYV